MPEDLLTIFLDYARAAGATAELFVDLESAAAAIQSATSGPLRVSAAVFRRFAGLKEALEPCGPIEIDDTPVEVKDRRGLAEELAGGTALLLARAGVAETGSVLLSDNSLAIRLLGMLSELCIVVLPAEYLLADLDAAGDLLADLDKAGHRYSSLVTGPSRTADIERVLTIGVHGPRALRIAVLDDPPARSLS